jgi:aspartyl-tRNA(Asn)/glutamyl-tRNA(Gln) amidotransferase subunit B
MTLELEPVIGLEVHAQLDTESKIFCGCSTRFGQPPNTQICPVCTGQPGVLPVLNREVIELALRMALAVSCDIRRESRFARKNYFYPDLPKGYQISQYEEPLAEGGAVEIWLHGQRRKIGITRIHVEEDAGKSIHHASAGVSYVDLNRAGVPLIEIVGEPDLRSPEEAAEYMRTLRSIVRALGICDGNLEEGSLRCDANVSLRPKGTTLLGTKVEVKNLNSFRFLQKALEHEIERQGQRLRRGEPILQETRLWQAELGLTESMRSKEEAHDYRYFPEPDLPPLVVDEDWIERLRREIPELPVARRGRFVEELRLSDYDAAELTREKELGDFFEKTVASGARPKLAANWILTELLSRVEDPRHVFQGPVSPPRLAGLLRLVEDGRISGKLAKGIWPKLWATDKTAEQIAEEEDLFVQRDADAIEEVVRKILTDHPGQVETYRSGKTQLLGFFVGRVMKATAGKADPKLVSVLLRKHLGE